MEIKLRHCPFCGADARLVKSDIEMCFNGDMQVVCTNPECGCCTPKYGHKADEAIAIWNNRINDEDDDYESCYSYKYEDLTCNESPCNNCMVLYPIFNVSYWKIKEYGNDNT